MDKKHLEERRPQIEYLNDPIVTPSTTRGLEAADLFDGARIMLRSSGASPPGEPSARSGGKGRKQSPPGEPWEDAI